MDYKLFIIPLVVMLIAQTIKVITESIKSKGFNWQRINGYGGMPSGHSAMVTSLSMTIGYYQGITHPAFAVALILTLLTIRDAYGFRDQISQHSKILNRLIKELPDKKEYKFPVLPETLGHKTTEVLAGVILGLALTYIIIKIWV